MFIEAIIVGLILGLLLKGKISNLNNLKINGINILIIILVIDLLLRQFIVNSSSELSIILFEQYPKFNLIVYFITIVVLGINTQFKEFRIIQAGYVLNFLPMIFNGGKMPVSEVAMTNIGKFNEIEILRNNLYLGHSLLNDGTRFSFIADTIGLTFPTPKVISIGDIIISLGIIAFLVIEMRRES